jgi:hypothetical protein
MPTAETNQWLAVLGIPLPRPHAVTYRHCVLLAALWREVVVRRPWDQTYQKKKHMPAINRVTGCGWVVIASTGKITNGVQPAVIRHTLAATRQADTPDAPI